MDYKQMVFSGKARRGDSTIHHSFSVNGHSIPLCFGTIYRDIGMRKIGALDFFGWGYKGRGPELLAVNILGMYARAEYGWLNPEEGYTKLAGPSHVFTFKTVNGWGPRVEIPEWVKLYKKHPYLGDDFIKKHYKAFTAEVIAKLPDNWTLTEADITAWIKKQEEKK